MLAKDRARETRLQPYGWAMERCTWFDVRCRAEELRRRVLARAVRLQIT